MSWFGAEHPYANQSPLLLTVRSGRSYHFMTTSQTMIPFVVLFMITLSSAVRFMVAALDKTVLMLEMLSSVPSSINTRESLTISQTVTISVPPGLFQ